MTSLPQNQEELQKLTQQLIAANTVIQELKTQNLLLDKKRNANSIALSTALNDLEIAKVCVYNRNYYAITNFSTNYSLFLSLCLLL